MRCRCSLSLPLVSLALFLLTVGSASAQVTAGGGDIGKGGIRVDVDLSADAEVPGPGDAELAGEARLVVDPRRDRICFDIDLDVLSDSDGVDTVVAVHIHPGEPGEACSGDDCPAPIDLAFNEEGLEGCVRRIGTPLLNAIVDQPSQFYLHVHTARFPAGAVRGALEDSDPD